MKITDFMIENNEGYFRTNEQVGYASWHLARNGHIICRMSAIYFAPITIYEDNE